MTAADLPLVNASINSVVAVLLIAGYVAIRRNARELHKWLMIGAVALSALFLISYVYYHYNHGSTKFTGQGIIRPIYFTILISHTILAIVNLPFVVITIVRAWRGQFAAHRRVAKRTWAIWVYVAITGPLVYLMLYRMYPAGEAAAAKFGEARALHRGGKDAEALAAYREAEKLGARHAGCYAAVIEDRVKQTDTASLALSRALAEEPNNAHCIVLFARELVLQDRADEAIPMLEKATQEVPNDDFFWASLAFAHFRKMNYREAAAAFEKSIALDATQPANVYNAGYAYFLAGDYKKARPLLERALGLQLDPELVERAKEHISIVDGGTWICPMHPEVTGKPGDKCPRCGMALAPAAHGIPEE